jgi:3-hydroxyacyl-CoA dehydrogenase/enoyl-CoA hydratase/3-hydroxybutyryl-CoA epimerase
MTHSAPLRWQRDPDGVVVLTFDDPARSVNTMNAAYTAAMTAAVDRLHAERDTITGVVLASAKQSFFAGADLAYLSTFAHDPAAVFAWAQQVKRDLRRLERLGRPVVAALGGSALGGGFEIALACHRRIAADLPESRFGQPEVGYGLLPGGGGIVRTVRLLGVIEALDNVLLHGNQYPPRQAAALGLVDALVDDPAELIARAKEWIAAHPDAAAPWDAPGFRIPGGRPDEAPLAARLPGYTARLRARIGGAPYAAPRAILAAAVESAQVDLDTALTVESRYLAQVAGGAVNMIKGLFTDRRRVAAAAARPQGVDVFEPRRIGVLGAGMMGAGIAYACADSAIPVVLKDATPEAALRGRDRAVAIAEAAVRRGGRTREQADALIARITPARDAQEFEGCDAVIEAVFEDPDLKRSVLKAIEPIAAPGALMATNTSTLPVGGLACALARPEAFLGLHFFSPVDRMQLVEVVVAQHTGDAALHRALDLVRRLGKTPVVVRDGRGFFTSRVINARFNEAVALIGEGVPAPCVEQAALQAGYPTTPLKLVDEISLSLLRDIRRAAGTEHAAHPADAVFDRMLDELHRAGRAAGAGFYEYENGVRTRLWHGLAAEFGPVARVAFEDVRDRLLFAEALEAIRCVDACVVRGAADANVASLLGIGFPAWTGGAVQYAAAYPGGPAGFAARARALAARYGGRFTPPPSLIAKAERGLAYP